MNIFIPIAFLLLLLLASVFLIRLKRSRQIKGEKKTTLTTEPEDEDTSHQGPEIFGSSESLYEFPTPLIDIDNTGRLQPLLELDSISSENPMLEETKETIKSQVAGEKGVKSLEKTSILEPTSSQMPIQVHSQDFFNEECSEISETKIEAEYGVDSVKSANSKQESCGQPTLDCSQDLYQRLEESLETGIDSARESLIDGDNWSLSNTSGVMQSSEPHDQPISPSFRQDETKDIHKPLKVKKNIIRLRRYKPPVLTPSLKSRKQQSKRDITSNGLQEGQKLPILVRVYFHRGDFIQLSFLLGKRPDIPDEVTAIWEGQEVNLFALTNEWFEGISPGDLSHLLEIGIKCETKTNDGKLLRWSLSGRPLYVLSISNSLSGFISTTRLVLGENQVILCKKEILESVLSVITETASPAPEVFGLNSGVPEGWVCLRNVVPKKPVPQVEGQDILNILRPLPDVEIILGNGIRIENSVWLAGYPPKIHLQGDLSIVDSISIDGIEAIAGDNSKYSAPGWDLPGDHNVYTGGKNKSYTIREIGDGWEVWEAHIYPRRRDKGKTAICGPLVISSESANELRYPVIVPSKNSVLIGAAPGQIYNCQVISGDKALYCGDFSPFQQVWALPSNPLQVDKYLVRILLVGEILPPRKVQNLLRLSQTERDLVWKWANIILAVSRKGLLVEPPTSEIKDLWRMYKQQAKAIWKIMR